MQSDPYVTEDRGPRANGRAQVPGSFDRRPTLACSAVLFHMIDIGAHLSGDPSSWGKPCLLLVEDQPTEWFLYGDLLSAEYGVKFAMNGEEVLAAVRR